MQTPLFIFSLPRSGSTLLQRILTASGHISSSAEPWLLLPFIYTMKPTGVVTEYWHRLGVEAVKDFYEALPNGRTDYTDALRRFILELYQRRSNPEAHYFLDKSPRYHLICDEIVRLFPEGKFIFLTRNPLAVAASIVNSWYRGKWKLPLYYIDLYDGLLNLLRTFGENGKVMHPIRYEELVKAPAEQTKRICAYLNLEYTDKMIFDFKEIRFSGRMGDKVGTVKYDAIHRPEKDAWVKTFNNPFRRRWARGYLKWIGRENLNAMGYDNDALESALSKQKGISLRSLSQDLFFTARLKITNYLSPLRVHHDRSFYHLYR